VPIVGPPPALDPDCAAGLAAFPALKPVADDLEAYRRLLVSPELAVGDDVLRRGGEYSIHERTVPGPPGDPEITLLICLPAATQFSAPAIYYTHGGGLVAGSRRSLVHEMLELAAPQRTAVVSVEYRLPPEHPDPAPVEDCYAGLSWTAQHADELGIDSERILIAGSSAGGCLAAGVALLVRDRGGPPLCGQMLISPMLDDRNDTASCLQMQGVDPFSRPDSVFGWRSLLGQRQGGGDVSHYAAPGRATDLSGLPPTFVDVGSAETLRDEAVAYASRIWQAGGDAELHVWPGGFHGYAVVDVEAPLARAALGLRRNWLTRLLMRLDSKQPA
jgi:acetyl esterase/lipase